MPLPALILQEVPEDPEQEGYGKSRRNEQQEIGINDDHLSDLQSRFAGPGADFVRLSALQSDPSSGDSTGAKGGESKP